MKNPNDPIGNQTHDPPPCSQCLNQLRQRLPYTILFCQFTLPYNYYIYKTNKLKLNVVIPQLDTSTQPLATNTLTYDSLQITATHNKEVFEGKLDRPMAASYQQFLRVTVKGNNLYIKRRFHLCYILA